MLILQDGDQGLDRRPTNLVQRPSRCRSAVIVVQGRDKGLDRAEEVRRNGSQARLFIRNGVLHIPVGPCESILCILCEEFGGL